MLARRLLIVFLLMAGTAFSQDISGSIDGYYQYNINRPNGAGGSVPGANYLRAFDVNHSSISLNYAELVVEKKPEKIGFRVDVGIGDTARIVHAVDPTPGDKLQYLQQAYISAKPGDRFQVDFGKFVTPMGAEVIETKDNWNYSRGILFTYAVPLYHFGLRATLAQSDNVTLTTFLVNGWNNVKDNNTSKTAGLQITAKTTDGKFSVMGNYLAGQEGLDGGSVRHTFDAVFTYEVSDKLALMANYDYGVDGNAGGKADWKGVAGYLKYSPMEKLKIVPRWEYFKDVDGFTTGTIQQLQEATLTAQYDVGEGATFWTEFRRDWNWGQNNPEVFPVKDNRLKHFQSTFLVGLTYAFKK